MCRPASTLWKPALPRLSLFGLLALVFANCATPTTTLAIRVRHRQQARCAPRQRSETTNDP
eukprot:2496037-Amphidinium_carterae.1